MKNFICCLLVFIGCQFLNAQNFKESNSSKREQVLSDTTKVSTKSTSNKGIKNDKAKIEQYLIISSQRDTTYVDTTLTINKEYKFNYLRKDNFDKISFSNIGQTYNTLSADFSNTSTLPLFGARARHFNYMEVEDINYYHVPTPLTELFYKTAFEQGQVLDAFFTSNMSEQFNFSIAYKGLRSLGKYQHILTSTGNFRFTSNYITKNKRYQVRGHIVMQDLLNQENGGLTDADVKNFESGEQEFKDRSVFAPNFENAENTLEGKRFLLEHQYNIVKSSDSINNNSLSVGNIISFEDKYYQFRQAQKDDFFGEAFLNSKLNDKVTLENFYNRFSLNYANNIIGDINFNVDYNKYNYGYNSVTIIDGQIIKNRLKGSVVSLGGSYKKQIGGFKLNGELGVNVSGDFKGNFLNAEASYDLNENNSVKAQLNSSSKLPNYNYLLYQSDYISYNWDNSAIFKNVKTQQLSFQVTSKQIADLSFDYTLIDNYTYFKKDSNNFMKPYQSDETVNYLRLKLHREFKYGNLALDNTIMYQNVLSGKSVLHVPQIITRNTLYYSNHIFKKALYLQTGITLNYFAKYNMNAYDPLLAEFYVQDQTQQGAFPRLDFFINAKIRQTRIYLKAEHFNAAFTGYNYYSAPNNPYRDFTIRFGLVWNFFL
ncbi:MAG: putative porin [Gelidibacter sp.]|nr:putative porin [Gelidibacter sp.]